MHGSKGLCLSIIFVLSPKFTGIHVPSEGPFIMMRIYAGQQKGHLDRFTMIIRSNDSGLKAEKNTILYWLFLERCVEMLEYTSAYLGIRADDAASSRKENQ